MLLLSVAAYSLIGIATIPKLMAPFQIALRGMVFLLVLKAGALARSSHYSRSRYVRLGITG